MPHTTVCRGQATFGSTSGGLHLGEQTIHLHQLGHGLPYALVRWPRLPDHARRYCELCRRKVKQQERVGRVLLDGRGAAVRGGASRQVPPARLGDLPGLHEATLARARAGGRAVGRGAHLTVVGSHQSPSHSQRHIDLEVAQAWTRYAHSLPARTAWPPSNNSQSALTPPSLRAVHRS